MSKPFTDGRPGGMVPVSTIVAFCKAFMPHPQAQAGRSGNDIVEPCGKCRDTKKTPGTEWPCDACNGKGWRPDAR
jgi:hypothetical protein